MIKKFRSLIKTTRIFRVATIIVVLGSLPLMSGGLFYLGKSVLISESEIDSRSRLTPWELHSVPNDVLQAEQRVDALQSEYDEPNTEKRLEYLTAKSNGKNTKEMLRLELDRRLQVRSWRHAKKRKNAVSTALLLFGAALGWAAAVLALFSSIYWVMLPKEKSR